MKTKRETLFARFEPPADGIERMAVRIANAPARASARAWRWAGATVAVVLASVVLVLLGGHFHQAAPPAGGVYDAPEFDRLLGRNVEPYKLSVRLNQQQVRIVELPTSDPKIRIYALQH